MAKYRKKPVVIDAILYSGYNGNGFVFDEAPEWFTDAIGRSVRGYGGKLSFLIQYHVFLERALDEWVD